MARGLRLWAPRGRLRAPGRGFRGDVGPQKNMEKTYLLLVPKRRLRLARTAKIRSQGARAEGPGSWGPDVGPFAPAKTGPKPAPEARSVDVPYWRLYVS